MTDTEHNITSDSDEEDMNEMNEIFNERACIVGASDGSTRE